MADKEATVYIVDLGHSMGKKHNGRQESDFDWAMTYVWEKITSTVSTSNTSEGWLFKILGSLGSEKCDPGCRRLENRSYRK